MADETQIKETETPEVKPKRVRVKTKSLDEIIEAKPSTLTQKELLMLVEYLKEQRNAAAGAAQSYKNNAAACLEKVKVFERKLQEHSCTFNDIQQAMAVAYKTILLLTKESNND